LTRARDVANVLSTATNLATDTETAAAISSHNIATNGHVGRGTTANRPSSPVLGDLYFDTTLDALIAYRNAGWEKVSQDPAPQIASISPTTASTTGTVVTITGSGFKSGLAVQFIGTDLVVYNSPIATFVNGTTATATTPNLPVAYEPYDIKLINSDNQFGILENILDSGGTPVWNTASGTIATINEQTSLNVSVSATDPDGTSIIYSSSNLPSWISLNSSTGALTGTSPDISSDTTYSFDITASDGVNSSSRSFNVISTLPPLAVNYLVVGGGGAGGGGSGAGGGGAGGYRTGTLNLSVSTNYSISVGIGGQPGSTTASRGGNGSQSQLHSIYASGGGGGGSEGDVGSGVRAGASGGSGGGGCYINSGAGGAGGSGNSGSYSPSEGNNGGSGALAGGSNYGGGGGGGSASVGSNAPGSGNGGNGGSGTSNSITGTSLFYAAGGGGGAQLSNAGATPGSGGSGIGGTGGIYNGAAATPGSANTGSGGGGGAYYGSNPANAAGAAGGSGVVIIKYPSSYSISQSGGLTLSTSTSIPGYKVTSFTAGSGTVTFNG
jgi:hypothetical protein